MSELKHITRSWANAGAISPDQTKYVYEVMDGNELNIGVLDLRTLDNYLIKISNHLELEKELQIQNFGGGDLAFDKEGNLWFSRHSSLQNVKGILAKIELDFSDRKGTINSVIPVQKENGDYLGSPGIAFLPNGYLVASDSFSKDRFIVDPKNGSANLIGNLGYMIDLASTVYHSLSSKLSIEKIVDKQEVYPGQVLTYTIMVENSGNIASSLTQLSDELPANTTYVKGSTTLNGEKIEDVNETSPLFNEMGMYVSSPTAPSEIPGTVYSGKEHGAIVTFQVKVDEKVEAGTIILNVANVINDSRKEPLPSNETKTIVKLAEPVKDKKTEKGTSDKTEIEHNKNSDINKNQTQVKVSEQKETESKQLPNTATTIFNTVLIGFGLLVIGCALILVKRRTRKAE